MRARVRRAAPGGAGLLAAIVGLLLVSGVPAEAGSTPPQRTPQADGRVYVVQAIPDTEVSVSIDGGAPTEDVGTSEIVGPLRLSPGQHDVTVAAMDGSWELASSVDVSSGGSSDVVLHRPASPSGSPVVTTYEAPLAPVAQTKGRLLLAHTATVPPADVRLNGAVAFANIANGEYVEAEVPAGEHTAAIVPTGRKGPALLGPLALEVPALTLTSVYAIGSPSEGSMDVVVHQLPLKQRGSAAPDEINTGSAGLVDGVRVKEVGATREGASALGIGTGTATSALPALLAAAALAIAVAMVGFGSRPRRRRLPDGRGA
jgi:hypothetical protein